MISIVFENQNFIAADKPHGVLSVPGRAGEKDARPCLGRELAKKFGEILPTHRLDFEVSGLVLYARSKQAHRAANLWFENRKIHKLYEAWTEGPRAEDFSQPQVWESVLVRGKRRTFEAPHGKPSATRVRWLEQLSTGGLDFQRWNLEPLTGRGHQLRFELAKHGFPIVGDKLYGASHDFRNSAGIALRAIQLDLSDCQDAADFGLPSQLRVKGL